MTRVCAFELSLEDLTLVVEIMSTVPGVDTPQQALSWALQNATRGSKRGKEKPPSPPNEKKSPIKLIDLKPDTHLRIQVHPGLKMTFPDKTTWKLHDNMMLIDIDKLSSMADAGNDHVRGKIAGLGSGLAKFGS